MKCPNCGREQPFDFKCVQCDTDIAAKLKSQRGLLVIYRVIIVCLVGLAFWLANSPSQESGPFEERSTQAPRQAVEPTPTETRAVAPRATEHEVGLAPKLDRSVLFLLQKKRFEDYQVLEGFRDIHGDSVQTVSVQDARDVRDALGNDLPENRLVVALGRTAIAALSDWLEDQPSLGLALRELPSSLTLPEGMMALHPHLSPLDQWPDVQGIFSESREIFFISRETANLPTEESLRERQIKWRNFQPDAVNLEGELASATAKGEVGQVLLWFHKTTPAEMQKVIAMEEAKKANSVATFLEKPEDSSRDLGENTPRAFYPLVEVSISPLELGRQAGLLALRLQAGDQNLDEKPYLKSAVEVLIHLERALASDREAFVDTMKARARRQGLIVRLVP